VNFTDHIVPDETWLREMIASPLYYVLKGNFEYSLFMYLYMQLLNNPFTRIELVRGVTEEKAYDNTTY
jgi:hypothetical protein